MFLYSTIRRFIFIACLLAAAPACAEEYNFNIPPQAMAASLENLARQGKVRLMYSPEAVRGLTAPAVRGTMTPEQAVARLLAGTGLRWVASENVIAVKAPRRDDSSSDSGYEIVVSATRTANAIEKVPASVSLVTREDFEEQQASTVNEVMKRLPNVDFGGGPRSDGQIPTIRGYQGNSITLLVDGARRNANYGLTTPLFIDPYFLSRAEVVRGPSSSLYGSGGNGGAMSFTTLAARDLLKPDQDFGAEIKAGYGSGDKSQRYNGSVYGAGDTFDALLAMGYQDFSDIRQANGTMLDLNSGFSRSGLFKAGMQANAHLRLEASYQALRKRTLEPNNPQVVTASQTQMTYNSQDEAVLKALMEDDAGEKTLDVRIYDTRTQNKRDPNGMLPYWNSKIETIGGSIQNTSRIEAGGMGSHRLTYGVDGYQDQLNSISGTTSNPVNPDGKALVGGLFLQDEIAIGDWRITPSLRYDRFSASPANTALSSTSNGHLSPKLAIAWQVTHSLNLFTSYGQAYRAPTIWETYSSTLTGGTYPTTNFYNFAANPNLKPETDTTFEVGANFKREGLIASDDKLTFRATAFWSKAKDMIESAVYGTYTRTGLGLIILGPNGLIFQSQNVSSAKRNGVEVDGAYEIGAWRLHANYSHLRVTNDVTGDGLFSPPDKLAADLGYLFTAVDMSVTWATTAVAAQDYDATIARQRKGYSVHDLFLTWFSPDEHFQLNAGIGNLFDKKYMVYQSSNALAANTYEMGRNYRCTVSASF